MIRLLGVAVLGVAIVAWAILSGGDEGGGEDNGEPAASATEDGSGDGGGEIACGGEQPPEADPQEYEEPGLTAEDLEQGVDYGATIQTSCGPIEMDLLEEEAPETVASFIFLAREGFYDGLIWHRVERDFVIQTGDPNGQNGTPPDGPGYTIADEFPDASSDYVYGTVGMANAGPGTTGSQFFVIVHEPADEPAGLQPLYSIFATVDESSYQVLADIAAEDTVGGNDPVQATMPIRPIYINSIEITES
jgi:cyclophilin family peptidyl-prolyl cis-trans isomerase